MCRGKNSDGCACYEEGHGPESSAPSTDTISKPSCIDHYVISTLTLAHRRQGSMRFKHDKSASATTKDREPTKTLTTQCTSKDSSPPRLKTKLVFGIVLCPADIEPQHKVKSSWAAALKPLMTHFVRASSSGWRECGFVFRTLGMSWP